MPGMNGLEVQERLASRGNRLPVIFITAYDEAGVRDRALAAAQSRSSTNLSTTNCSSRPCARHSNRTWTQKLWRGGNRASDGTVVRSGLLRLCSSQLGKIS